VCVCVCARTHHAKDANVKIASHALLCPLIHSLSRVRARERLSLLAWRGARVRASYERYRPAEIFSCSYTVCTYIHSYIYIHVHTHTYTSLGMHTYICIRTWVHQSIYICAHARMSACTCMYSRTLLTSPQQFGKERRAQPPGLETHGRTPCSVVCLPFSLPLREFATSSRVQCQVCWNLFISRLVVRLV
jgi:hypothetical protein